MLADFRDQPTAYYLSLPPPWNTPPDRPVRAQEAHKMSRAVEDFDGTALQYTVWRAGFLSMVHRCVTEIDQKIRLLFKSFTPDTRIDPRVAGLRRLPPTPETYKMILETLETEFGGDRRLLTSTMKIIKDLGQIRITDVAALRQFRMHVRAYVQHCRQAGRYHDANNVTLFNTLCASLTPYAVGRYRQHVIKEQVDYDVDSLLGWLDLQIRQYRDADFFYAETSTQAPTRRRSTWRAYPAIQVPEDERDYDSDASQDSIELAAAYYAEDRQGEEQCPACGKDHELTKCETFRNLTTRERRKVVAAARACYVCLLKGHVASKCQDKKPCTSCPRLHHPMLHEQDGVRRPGQRYSVNAYAATGGETQADQDRPDEEEEQTISAMPATGPGCALRTLPVLLVNRKNGKREVYNAFVDDGCSHALVSERVAKDLALKGEPIRTNIQGVGGHRIAQQSYSVELQIQSLTGPTKRNIRAQVLPTPAGTLMPTDWSKQKELYPHLKHIEFPTPVHTKGIDILIGQACPDLLASKEEVTAGPTDPVARRTLLGWTAAGPLPGNAQESLQALFAFPAGIEGGEPGSASPDIMCKPRDQGSQHSGGTQQGVRPGTRRGGDGRDHAKLGGHQRTGEREPYR